jgi:hypothetical protein
MPNHTVKLDAEPNPPHKRRTVAATMAVIAEYMALPETPDLLFTVKCLRQRFETSPAISESANRRYIFIFLP